MNRGARCWFKAHAVEAPEWARSRIQHTFVGGGRGTGLHIFNLYCPCDDPTGAATLVAIALTAAENLGNVAALIAGDINTELKEAPLGSGLAWASWKDRAAGLGHAFEVSDGSYSNP